MENEFENNAYFWQKVDAAYLSGDFKVKYKKGSKHPTYSGLKFPVDYGHVSASDDNKSIIKAFKSNNGDRVDAVVICANLIEKDLSAIALIGLNEDETLKVLQFLNSTDLQKAVIIKRGKDIPSWAIIE